MLSFMYFFSGLLNLVKNMQPEMKLGTESSKPEGIISLLYHFWRKSMCNFSKHQKREVRNIVVGVLLRVFL